MSRVHEIASARPTYGRPVRHRRAHLEANGMIEPGTTDEDLGGQGGAEVRAGRILDSFLSAHTRRWHTHAQLCATVDPVDGHGARVALIALALRPDLSREAIIYAIGHDFGEVVIGDMSGPAKRCNPDLSAAISAIEAQHRDTLAIPRAAWLRDADRIAVEVADKLDSWLWAVRHRPELDNSDAWRQMIDRTIEHAEKIDAVAGRAVRRAVGAVRDNLERGGAL